MSRFSNKREAACYLAAMIDGEGSVANYGKYGGNRLVRVSNTVYALIEACAECCDLLGIKYQIKFYDTAKRRAKGYKPYWNVQITGRTNFEILLSEVPIQSPLKSSRLREMVGSYKTKRFQQELRIANVG